MLLSPGNKEYVPVPRNVFKEKISIKLKKKEERKRQKRKKKEEEKEKEERDTSVELLHQPIEGLI